MITTTATKADRVGVLRREIAGLLTRAFAMRGHAGTPALDARLLVGHAIGIAPQEVPLRDEETVSEAQRELALAHAARRAAGEPVARIVGRKEFHGLEFMLSAETLVPRPETETLVDAALAIVAPDAHATIVDIGTGTGAILLSVLAERPNARRRRRRHLAGRRSRPRARTRLVSGWPAGRCSRLATGWPQSAGPM